MKRLIHSDNRAFWIKACDIAIRNICKQREEEQENYIRLSMFKKMLRAEPNPEKGIRLYWQEEVEIGKIRDLFISYATDAIVLDEGQMNQILFYADLKYHYKHFYDKKKDTMVREYNDGYSW